MEEETVTGGKATLVGGIAGKQETCERALSTTRKYLAAITCVHTPAKFWARIGEAKSLKNFEGYLATLNEWCSLQKGCPTEMPKPKSYMAIKLESLCWQRAQVLSIINDERLSVFCIDTGVTTDIGIEQICAKQNPTLMQQPPQAIQCCLGDITSVKHGDWSEGTIERFKSLVKGHPVYVDFQTIKQVEGQMCSDILLFINDPTTPKGMKSVGKILSDEGLAKYVSDDDDDDDDDDDKVIKKHVTFNTKLVSANTDSAVINNKKMNASAAILPQDSNESSDDVVVEESSSEDERSLENCKRDATSSSSNTSSNSRNIAVDSMADSAVDSEQVVIGPSHLVENKNSFNIVSRAANYSSSSSSSDEGEDAWDDSLLAPVKPKPALGIMNKEDVEKNLEKRKALHAKFQEFLSAPLPLPSSSDRHPFGSRGKRGNRRGAHGIGRYAAIGRGKHLPVTSGWSDDHGNQTRSNGHHRKTLLSSQRQFPQQHFPQQQFPQQQFPQQQQQFRQQQFPHTQQQFPQQQQQQQYSQQQQQFPQQNFPQRQLPQRQFSQQQLFQQRFPAQQQFPRQQFPGQQLSLSKQDQPWQHNHSPRLRQLFTNKSPIKSTQQIPDTTSAPATMTTNTSTNITSIDQLDEQGMKNEYEWQKWMIERSVKKALEGLTGELVSDFNSQLKKILSDSSTITLNKFPSGKGAVWVIARSVCCFAVDKPAQRSKAVIALQEIHKTCTDEMVRLFPEVLQSCSEQVLKELSATNTQCGSYCDLVCSLHHSTAKDNTSLQVLMDTSLGQLLKFWTEYALNEKSSELECEGCVNLIVAIFTDILPHLTACNRPLLDRCDKMVRSLILSFIPRKPRENLLDFYMIIMRNRTDTVAVTSSLSSLSLDKTAGQTGMSDSGVFNPDKLNQPIVKPNQSSAMPDQSLIKIDQSSVSSDQSMVKPDQFSTAPNQSMVKIDQSSSKVDQTLVEPDQTLVEPVHSLASTVKPDHSIVPDQSSAELNQSKEPQQALINPDHFSVKPDQPVDQVSQVTVTTSDTPSHSTVVTATNSHERDVVSPMTSTMVAQSPPIHDAYCNVAAMLSALNLSYLLENFKAAIIQDNVLTCDPSGLKEAMKEAGIPSGAVLSILHYLSKTDVNAGRVQFPSQASCYQYPVHYPTAAAYGIQPSHQATYLQQPQPHPLAAATAQFNSVSHSHQMCTVPACGHSHQMYTVPASQQVVSPVGVPSPTHPFLQSASL